MPVDEDETAIVTTSQIQKKSTRVSYKLVDDSHEQLATVTGGAGRATGSRKFWFNIQKDDKSLNRLNFEVLQHWKELPTEGLLFS